MTTRGWGVRKQASERDRQVGILNYWRAVEYFSPPTVKGVNPDQNRYAVDQRQPLPWMPGSENSRKKLPPDKVWQHTVYAGVFQIKRVRDALEEVFRSPDEELDFDGRVKGETAMLSFTVTDAGQLIKASAALSNCAWAVGRTLCPGPQDKGWLDGWEEDSARVLAKLLDLGDGDVGITFGPGSGGPAPAGGEAGTGLGPIAGSTARILLDAAAGGLEAAATAAGTAAGVAVGGVAGPIAGAVVSKTLSGIGDGLVDAARTKLGADKSSGNGSGGAKAGTVAASDDDHDGDDEPPAIGTEVLTVDDLAAITRWVADELGIGEKLRPEYIRVESKQVSAKRAEQSSEGLLSSFFAEDLNRVSKAAASGEIGRSLTEYLRSEDSVDPTSRVDLRRSLDVLFAGVQPSALPLGRWPGKAEEPLALSQQFAVNRLFAQLGAPDARGLYAVNGPPGTGKTTMLRDVIAEVVVRRAEVLAELAKAEDAFAKTPLKWQSIDGSGKVQRRTIRPLIPRLTGFEMLVASSNNGAVNNITLEIPGMPAVQGWESEASYLRGPASNLRDEPVWGAVAARLGRRAYRQDFVEDFWWANDKKNRKSPGLQQLLRQHEDIKPGDVPTADAPLGTETWAQAKKRFLEARRRVEEMIAERQGIADAMAALSRPDATLARLDTEAGTARRQLAVHEATLDTQTAAWEAARSDRTAAKVALTDARSGCRSAEDAAMIALTGVEAAETAIAALGKRPGRIRDRLSKKDLRGQWERDRSALLIDLEAADRELQARHGDLDLSHRCLRSASKNVTDAEAALRSAARRMDDARILVEHRKTTVGAVDSQHRERLAELRLAEQDVAKARARWGESVPGDEWAARFGDVDADADADSAKAMQTRELSAPWMDPELAEARTRLFLAALDLHRAVLVNAPKLVRTNLLAAMEIVKGTAPADLAAATVLAGWQMLFLVVPVVSSTFASIGRMLPRLGSESLGWLFVDEAGQAAPQQAVGALWRFRRAVIVGDPLQLEPVVTLPWTAQTRLARRFEVRDEWAPSRASAQALADRVATYGTWLSGVGGEQTWVASPLRVHRRCDRLMFEVSNEIAYDGMMVYGVKRGNEYPFLARSGWSHIAARPGGDKWNPTEGDRVVEILKSLGNQISARLKADAPQDWDDLEALRHEVRRQMAQSVFVVSPFVDIANGLQRLLPEWLPKDKDTDRVGTVHVTQGKEADVVIMVLGTATDQPGSRRWAAQRPNLLNVAVTRAKRRLIVVGDHDNWSPLPFFSVLANHELLGDVVGLD
ncbi:DEAD/DEAH box helicase [Catenulispora pinisilvae]|uniref:DEAD/DEAH box helicase n=1 Tax=Catenulispora pinisilvae TaxID=2705253 RepID=UPI001891A969|nr:DEAD/DEAH box helicase [Catenulispora pinisilvae]